MLSTRWSLGELLIGLVGGGAVLLLSTRPSSSSEALQPGEADVVSYAEEFDVPVAEAEQRLDWQQRSGEVKTALRQAAPDRLAGVWTEHEPDWRVVVWYTGTDEGLGEAFEIAARADLPVEVRTGARHTLDELEAIQVEASLALAAGALGSSLDMRDGSVIIRVLEGSELAADSLGLEQQLELEYGVDFKVVVTGPDRQLANMEGKRCATLECDLGDSGGPTFLNTSAYGILTHGTPSGCVYLAIDYLYDMPPGSGSVYLMTE